LCPAIHCDVAVKIKQSRLRIDRGEKYLFALAVENCITGVTYAATRVKGEVISNLQELVASKREDRPDVLRNGSIMRVVMKSFFDFSEINELTPIPWPKELQP
jgi:hypothetical protein